MSAAENTAARAGGARVRPHTDRLADAARDALAAERFLRECTGQLTHDALLAEDVEWATIAHRVHALAQRHFRDIEALLEQIECSPGTLGGAFGSGLSRVLGLLEKLASRDLVHASRHVYVALHYTVGSDHALYTLAVLLDRPAAARVALRHLREYTPRIRELRQWLAWASALSLPGELWQGAGKMDRIVPILAESWDTPMDPPPDPRTLVLGDWS